MHCIFRNDKHFQKYGTKKSSEFASENANVLRIY
jgi:hypothetical protein